MINHLIYSQVFILFAGLPEADDSEVIYSTFAPLYDNNQYSVIHLIYN